MLNNIYLILQLQVTMEPVDGIALAEGRERQVICMCNSQSTTLEYEIVPHIIGRRELTFRVGVKVKGLIETNLTYPTMHLSRIPQYTTLEQKCTHFCSSVLYCGILGQVHCGVCEIGRFISWVLHRNSNPMEISFCSSPKSDKVVPTEFAQTMTVVQILALILYIASEITFSATLNYERKSLV